VGQFEIEIQEAGILLIEVLYIYLQWMSRQAIASFPFTKDKGMPRKGA